MKTLVPNYYNEFCCIAGECRHTCCEGWEIDVDEESLPKFLADTMVAPHISLEETPHIVLCENERCPFLNKDGLCEMIIRNGEGSLCQICRDHPRFKNYWSGVTEIGLGLVCEEAGRIILSRTTRMELCVLEDDGKDEIFSDDEKWLWNLRNELWNRISETGYKARLKEYLIFRHLADALYDGMVDARIRFIEDSYNEILRLWDNTDGTLDSLVEACRSWSYDVEYDDEVLNRRLSENKKF